jgi:hypothetical protein
VNIELEMVWKKAPLAQIEVLFQNFPEEKIKKKKKDRWCLE